MNYEQKYNEALERAKEFYNDKDNIRYANAEGMLEDIFPELKESEDERIRKEIINYFAKGKEYLSLCSVGKDNILAWLERQGSEPNWCHHKVDLSGCSEEYRKAYYDGWNNCNHQHSQCKSEWNDVVKCLINGMKFYYEDNEEATWGTEKFSMKVKDILSWLEKQGEQKPTLRERYKNIAESEWFKKTYEGMSISDDEEVSNVNKAEPKFKIGDSIKTTNEEPLIITKIDDKGYWSEDLLICGFDDAAKWELVEQKPWSEEDEMIESKASYAKESDWLIQTSPGKWRAIPDGEYQRIKDRLSK